tara:strand:+ start:2028 stop:2363 length:336 start_codon:yes stop_codon:yes gene_type:complete
MKSLRASIGTPYGDIVRDGNNKFVLEYPTNDFYSFSEDVGLDIEIATWLIDNGYTIVSRVLSYNSPAEEFINFIYYNPETEDYEEIDISCDYNDSIDLGIFVLKFEVKKRA